jgi:phosphopantetheine adenylyltransferase
VIGPNPWKTIAFSREERLSMLKSMFPDDLVAATEDVWEYVEDQKRNALVTMVRGVRDSDDFEYEQDIARTVADQNGIPTFLVACPKGLAHVSSTSVKDLCNLGKLQDVESCLDENIFAQVVKQLDTGKIPTDEYSGFPSDDSNSLQQCASHSGHEMPLSDHVVFCSLGLREMSLPQLQELIFSDEVLKKLEPQKEVGAIEYSRHVLLDRMRLFHEKMRDNGLFDYVKTITPDHVQQFLDPVGFDVIASSEFHLKEVPVAALTAFGGRWETQSRSLGPIIVETNHFESWRFPHLGPNVIIEGKHRWLDAKERGDETILAWVGNLTSL